MSDHSIKVCYLSQEDFIQAGTFSLPMAIEAAENALLAYQNGDWLF